jgi:hypothetical protein
MPPLSLRVARHPQLPVVGGGAPPVSIVVALASFDVASRAEASLPAPAPPSRAAPSIGIEPASVRIPVSGIAVHMLMSGGHEVLVPSQSSGGSHVRSVDMRHTTPAESTASGGQFGSAPVHDSGTSHAPAEGRHTTPLA